MCNVGEIRLSYVIMPLITFGVMLCSKIFTAGGMAWYKTLTLPSITPPGWVFSIAWQIIFTCTTISAILIWEKTKTNTEHQKKLIGFITLALFAVNAVLNVLWTLLFFKLHNTWGAFVEAWVLQASVITLIGLTWLQDKRASILLIPYAVWLSFAIYLNYEIWQLNKATFYLFKWLF